MSIDTYTADKIRKVLNGYPEILFASVFGSFVKNRMKPESDIDISVAGERPLSFEKKNDLVLDLEKELHRQVDLVDLQSVSGIILQQALCTGEVVLKKSSPFLAGLIKKMWYDQADMMPNTKMIMERQISRFIHE